MNDDLLFYEKWISDGQEGGNTESHLFVNIFKVIFYILSV